jgi:NAD(P)-dependent dehydrogenase (short-subunit alcohol dehydrogenase family)
VLGADRTDAADGVSEATGTPFSIRGRRTVIAGATAGIGLSVARHFVREGARVVITGRRADGPAIAAAVGAMFVPMDVGLEGSVRAGMGAAAAHLGGGFDVMILNAGISLGVGTVDGLDLDAFRRVMEVNFFGVVHGLHHGLPHMGAGGSIIVTSSPGSRITMPGLSAYSASKAAVDMLVRTSAIELARRGIRINSVLPGNIASEMAEGVTGDAEQVRILTVAGTVRSPDDLGPVYQFLASDASLPFSGAAVPADDGISAGYSAALVALAGFDDGRLHA